ncbi:MAG TPA: hypothetical protein VF516_11415 [Kofleriaceae bacterium]
MGKGDSRPPQQSAATKPAGPEPARIPKSSTPPLTTSRTTTLDDPLTTSLLAEIARRSTTVEMSPAQLAQAQARAQAPGEPEPEPEPGENRDPDDPPTIRPDDPA